MSFGQAQSEQFAALFSDVENAPEWLQTNIARRLAITPPTQDNQATIGAVTELLAAKPIGNDAMVATPELTHARDDLAAAKELIQAYSNYPGVAQAFEAMVSANSQNPELLASLAREMIEQIEQVRSNPHVHHPAHPAIEQAIEAIRAAELQKPDPLNLLRGDQQEQGTTADRDVQAVQGALFGAVGLSANEGLQNLLLGTKHEPEVPALTQSPLAQIPGIGDVANMFKAALTNFEPSEQQALAGNNTQERDVTARGRFS